MSERAVPAADPAGFDGGFDGRLDAGQKAALDVMALLGAVVTVLRDTVQRFDQVSGKVTETILSRGNPEDHDLIVSLQDFDRLQQEFGALSDVFARCIETWNAPRMADSPEMPPSDAIEGVTLADLKSRLANKIRNEAIYLAARPTRQSSDDVF